LPRGLIIFVIVVFAVSTAIYWAAPAIKERFIGDSLQVKIKYLKVYDNREVESNEGSLARTVVDMEISFPIGSAPEHVEDLRVTDNKGQPLKEDVFFDQPVIREDYDHKVTCWRMTMYLPFGFREGKLWSKTRELAEVKFPQKPPFGEGF